MTYDLDLNFYFKVKVKGQDLGHYPAKLLKHFWFAQNVFTFFSVNWLLSGFLHVKDYADTKFGCVPVACHLLCPYRPRELPGRSIKGLGIPRELPGKGTKAQE